MKLSEVIAFLDRLSPLMLAEKWDNCGLQVGDLAQEISDLVITLECDGGCIEAAPEGALIIAHHPLIFSPLRNLDYATYPAMLIRRLIEKRLSLVAMHTNFDKSHLNRYVTEEVFGFASVEEEGFVAYASWSGDFESLKELVRQRLGIDGALRVVEPARALKRIAVTTGSGASLLSQVRADCFLTGDIKYHDAVAAREMGIGLIDIGHYASERWFVPLMADQVKSMPLNVILYNSENPFLQG
ncbi:MAG: Nif3-like dinuclear metal center hexameric protein [Campylobacterales bacterium]